MAEKNHLQIKGGYGMMSQIMQHNVLIYGMVVVGFLGAASQVLLRIIYDQLIRDMERPAFAKSKYMRHLKQRYNIYKRTQTGSDSINVFIQKSLMEYKYMGMSLHTWRRLGGYVFALCACLGGMGWYLAGGQGISGGLRANYLWGVLASAFLVAGAYGVTDTGYRRKYLETGLRSIFTNSSTQAVQMVDLAGQEPRRRRTQDGKASPEPVKKNPLVQAVRPEKGPGEPQERKAAAPPKKEINIMEGRNRKRGKIVETKAQREKRELVENLARLKEGLAETAAAEREGSRNRDMEILQQMNPEEQERVIREVLKEFLV